MTLSQKLKSARISRKISQKTLAEALGVSRATVSLWESGKAVPPVQYLRKYQEIFGFEKGYFNDATLLPEPMQNIAFDISMLNQDGIAALKDFYEYAVSSEEYSKNT